MSTPEVLRDAGMETAENAADPRVILTIDALIAEANASGEEWSANTIRDRVPVSSRGLVGARVRAASMRKPQEMEAVGLDTSDLPSTHSKPIIRWKGVQ